MARRRGNSWQGSLKTPEKYHRYSFPTEALAEDWERRAREAHGAGLPVPAPEMDTSVRPSLRKFYRDKKEMIWPGVMPRNVESNQRAVERFLGPDTLLHHITEKRLTVMVEDMQRAGYKPSTTNTRLSHLKVLLRYAKRHDLVDDELEFPWVAKTEDNSRMRFLTEDEERRLLDLLDHWAYFDEKSVIETLIDTGCRPSELIQGEAKTDPIRWAEVSRSAGGTAPDVNDPATGEARAVISILRTKTKAKGQRVLPLTDRARLAFLKSKQRGDAKPFGNMRADDLSAVVRKAADHLGMHDVVLYTMRHTCASRLVQRGADLYRVMKWMGHTNITTTQRYAKLTPGDIFGIGDLL